MATTYEGWYSLTPSRNDEDKVVVTARRLHDGATITYTFTEPEAADLRATLDHTLAHHVIGRMD